MVIFCPIDKFRGRFDLRQDLCPCKGMSLDDIIFFICQFSRLTNNTVRNPDLSNIMQQCNIVDAVDLILIRIDLFCQHSGIFSNTDGMAVCIGILCIYGLYQGFDHVSCQFFVFFRFKFDLLLIQDVF